MSLRKILKNLKILKIYMFSFNQYETSEDSLMLKFAPYLNQDLIQACFVDFLNFIQNSFFSASTEQLTEFLRQLLRLFPQCEVLKDLLRLKFAPIHIQHLINPQQFEFLNLTSYTRFSEKQELVARLTILASSQDLV